MMTMMLNDDDERSDDDDSDDDDAMMTMVCDHDYDDDYYNDIQVSCVFIPIQDIELNISIL